MINDKWEYFVVHINFEANNNGEIEVSNPKSASDKLYGSLSPEYLKKEFPNQFKNKSPQLHPCKQLEVFLNKWGNERWKLTSTERVGGLLMFIFIREKLLSQNSEISK